MNIKVEYPEDTPVKTANKSQLKEDIGVTILWISIILMFLWTIGVI